MTRIAARAAAFYALWVVLIGTAPGDLAFGVAAAAAATWASVALTPPSTTRIHLGAALALLPRFAWQSLAAGFDVALRALAPRVRLAPGFIRFAVKAPRGPARNAFAMYTSLMPGTLPAADEEGALVYHCLDGNPEVAVQLAADERRLGEIVEDRPHA
ncbi:MAG: Na+/H+ antiporter subunit E [Burkholderiales bacterium]|nr:Na+/H+ antiporter subunit E [Burkholderiales bacterium]